MIVVTLGPSLVLLDIHPLAGMVPAVILGSLLALVSRDSLLESSPTLGWWQRTLLILIALLFCVLGGLAQLIEDLRWVFPDHLLEKGSCVAGSSECHDEQGIQVSSLLLAPLLVGAVLSLAAGITASRTVTVVLVGTIFVIVAEFTVVAVIFPLLRS